MSHKKKTWLKRALIKTFLLAICVGILASGAFLLWVATLKIPNLDSFESRRISQSTKIYDRTGTILLYDVHENIKRTIVPYEDISRHIKNATVAIEDAEFYKHGGIKVTSIIRAILADIESGGYSQGGSTITQQVVKNALLTSDKSISRKFKEWILAIKLEKAMTKDEILSLYLNESPYGGNVYGVEEASQAFFGKKASELDLAEAAYLASVPKAPTYYSPYGNNRQKLEERKNLVLQKMKENGFITDAEYEVARKEEVTFKPPENVGIKAPHFVVFIKQYLENKYGEKQVEEGGLKVITTLDYGLQEKAQDIVAKYTKANAEQYHATNAGMVAIDPQTGQILVMVGSRNYFDKDIDGNFNVALAHRQPGSSFKPFAYSQAFIEGYTPSTVLFDVPTEFQTTCTPQGKPINPKGDPKQCYMPVNYDNKSRGPITLRNALAQSVNVPSVKLLYLAGLQDTLHLAKDMGVTSLGDAGQYGLTLVLGGGEVTLVEMTSAYSAFATGGLRNPQTGILEITDRGGNVLEKFEKQESRVLPENIASTISDILSDDVARTPTFGAHSAMYFPTRDVAIKTGTSNDYRDTWAMGYSPNMAVGAWSGNNDNTPIQKKVAGFIVVPMWHAFMEEALKTVPDVRFKEPTPIDTTNLKPILKGLWQGGRSYTVDTLSGKLATQYTPAETRAERAVKNVHSILYWLDKNNPNGPVPTNPASDPQFEHWEYAIQEWAKKNNIVMENDSSIPTATDDIHVPESFPTLSISGLDPNPYVVNSRVTLMVANNNKYPLTKIDVYLNSEYIGSTSQTPYTFSFSLADMDNLKKENELRIVGTDAVFNKGEIKTTLRVN